jgi:hypothetical protein
MRGKLNVQFHSEEGIDAGGVTREWYQARTCAAHSTIHSCHTLPYALRAVQKSKRGALPHSTPCRCHTLPFPVYSINKHLRALHARAAGRLPCLHRPPTAVLMAPVQGEWCGKTSMPEHAGAQAHDMRVPAPGALAAVS